MHYMDSMADAIADLEAKGYREQLTLDEDGTIGVGDDAWGVEQIAVDEIARFEGISNPDDESMVLGIRGPDGRKGILTLPYGPDLSGAQADAVRHLAQQR